MHDLANFIIGTPSVCFDFDRNIVFIREEIEKSSCLSLWENYLKSSLVVCFSAYKIIHNRFMFSFFVCYSKNKINLRQHFILYHYYMQFKVAFYISEGKQVIRRLHGWSKAHYCSKKLSEFQTLQKDGKRKFYQSLYLKKLGLPSVQN